MNIGLVCGYGMETDPRLRQYLAEVLDYASEHELEMLILSGGYTLEDAEEPEARVMWRVMQPDISGFHVLFEERSISTLHNLLYSAQLIREQALPVQKLYIFCDWVRFLKVFCLSKIIFKRSDAQVVTFKREEPLLMYLMQIPFTALQCLGAVCPPFEKCLLRVRQMLRKRRQ
ncbi:MAG: hypothetical protein GY801_37565 [bacterium]|nr:hypothetical protein [bacterium]